MSSKIQNINRRLIILQYNVHTSKNLIMTLCLKNFVIKKFDILTIQKLWKNIRTKIIHHFLKNTFQLVYLDSKKINEEVIKICFFREQTHIHSRFKLFFKIKKFSHTTNKIDWRFQWRTLYLNIQSMQRIKYQIMHVFNWTTNVLKKRQIQQRKFRFIHATYHNKIFQYSLFDLKRRWNQSRFENIKIINNNKSISTHFEFQIRHFYLCQLQKKRNYHKCMFNNEKINKSHYHLQNSRKSKSWFRSFIYRNDFKCFDQHDSFRIFFLLRSFKQNQIRKYFKSKFSNISNVTNKQFLNDYIINVCKVII